MPPVTSFTVAQLIDEIRDAHVSFSAENHPRPVLLRHFQRKQDELHALASARNASWWIEDVEIANPNHTAGPQDIGEHRYVLGARGIVRDGRVDGNVNPKVTIVGYGSNNRSASRWAISVEGTVVRLVPSPYWNMFSSLIVSVAPKAAVLEADSHFELWDEAKTALLAGAALFLSARGIEGPTPANVKQWADDYERGLQLWLERISPSNQVRVQHTEDVL